MAGEWKATPSMRRRCLVTLRITTPLAGGGDDLDVCATRERAAYLPRIRNSSALAPPSSTTRALRGATLCHV